MNPSGKAREPSVAGQFYPGTSVALRDEVERLFGDLRSERAIGIMRPHAGYMYSGCVAGESVSTVAVPQRCVILGPNHTGLGPAVSVFPSGSWRMPFGEAAVDEALAGRILDGVKGAEPDRAAHLREHSI